MQPLGASGNPACPTAIPLMAVIVVLAISVLSEMLQEVMVNFFAYGHAKQTEKNRDLFPGVKSWGLIPIDSDRLPDGFFNLEKEMAGMSSDEPDVDVDAEVILLGGL